MKKIILVLLIINPLFINAQNRKLSDLESKKNNLNRQINVLKDSIKKIDSQITSVKSYEIQKMSSDSALTAVVNKGAKLKKTPSPSGEVISTLSENKKVRILDYNNGYFGVCADSTCGYMSELWIKRDEKINAFVFVKEDEERKLKDLQNEQKLKKQRAEWENLERKYIKKYGEKAYKEMKAGYFWIGMNKEMATISLGQPNDINRTVGSWGVHEQWVYDNLYLYFENGSLTSYQN